MARIRICTGTFPDPQHCSLIPLFPVMVGGGGEARLLWQEEEGQSVGLLHLHWSASNQPHICRSAAPAHEKNKNKIARMNYRPENIGFNTFISIFVRIRFFSQFFFLFDSNTMVMYDGEIE